MVSMDMDSIRMHKLYAYLAPGYVTSLYVNLSSPRFTFPLHSSRYCCAYLILPHP